MKIENKKKKKKKTFSPGWLPTGTKGPTHVARPRGLFSPGCYYQPGLKVVPGAKPGLKEGPFSPGFVLPVSKPGLKGVENREYNSFLY